MVGYLSLPGASGVAPMDVDGLRPDAAWNDAVANLDTQGNPVRPFLLAPTVQKIDDPPHDRPHIKQQISTPPAGGSSAGMGGFVRSYATSSPKDPRLVMGHYDARAVSTFDFLAREFAVCDQWYSALPTGTQANRLMAMAGQSKISNNVVILPDQPLVYDWLSNNKIPWCSYQWAGDPFFLLMPSWTGTILASLNGDDNRGLFRYFNDPRHGFAQQWASGDPFPAVVFIEPKYTDDILSFAAGNDDHLPTGIAMGQQLISTIYQTLISNPDRWKSTMLIITYDEHGGMFDHAPPLPIQDTAGGYRFKSTGVRVPAFVASPHVAQGKPFHGKLDHTSVLQLLADALTPGQPYSAAVTARQEFLTPLSSVLTETPAGAPRAPQIPAEVHQRARAAAAVAPIAPAGPDVPRTTDTAEAFHRMAHRIARERPDLLEGRHGQHIAEYVAESTASAPRKAAATVAAAPKSKPKKTKKPKARKPAKRQAAPRKRKARR
jgi:phospholipase C